MVGGDEDRRVVVQAPAAQIVQDPPHDIVGVGHPAIVAVQDFPYPRHIRGFARIAGILGIFLIVVHIELIKAVGPHVL